MRYIKDLLEKIAERWIRLRRALERQFAVFGMRLLMLAAAGAWVTYGAHITPGTTVWLPKDARGLPGAESETVVDTVDFAINTDNAVMKSSSGRTFHIVHDGYRYALASPTLAESASAPGALPTMRESDKTELSPKSISTLV